MPNAWKKSIILKLSPVFNHIIKKTTKINAARLRLYLFLIAETEISITEGLSLTAFQIDEMVLSKTITFASDKVIVLSDDAYEKLLGMSSDLALIERLWERRSYDHLFPNQTTIYYMFYGVIIVEVVLFLYLFLCFFDLLGSIENFISPEIEKDVEVDTTPLGEKKSPLGEKKLFFVGGALALIVLILFFSQFGGSINDFL